jgi:glucose/arabinose dehydrogenase
MVGLALVAAACNQAAKLPLSDGTGPAPVLPPPTKSLVPTVDVATAQGWPAGGKPTGAAGTQVTALAQGLEHPRWLQVLPNGDVLVAETNAPPKPDDAKGVRGWLMKKAMKKAGSAAPSADRISLLRDADGDHVAETRTVFLDHLSSPFGMALVGNDFYVADTDALLRFTYVDGATHITTPGKKVVDLPAGRINHHWTKNVIANADGSRLYVTVGSNSNAGENGMDSEVERAAIWEINPQSGEHRVFASGLRNPVGMAWKPGSDELWVAVNERDELGSDVPPDYLTAVKEGAFYGWPYSYFGQHVDDRVKPPRPDLVAIAVVPSYALGPHTASLGLASAAGTSLPGTFREGMFVGQHGSWNRKPRSGYKVVFVPFADGKPAGQPVDVLTSFLNERGEAQGRPVGVAIGKQGDLLVADDVGNTVWCVSAAGSVADAMAR